MGKLKPIEKKFKAFSYRVCRSFFKQGSTDFKTLDGNSLRKVLFLRPEKIGDMVISFPVFDGLRKQYPHIKISILGSPRNFAIIKNDPRFDKIYLYRKSLFPALSVIKEMRKEKYDCVVDMIGDDSVTALFLSQLSAPGKPRIGVGKERFREYYDYNYAYRTNNTAHVIENTLKLLEAFGIDSSRVSGYAPPYVTETEKQFAHDWVTSQKSDGSVRLVGYNLSAGAPSRLWAEDKTERLVQSLLKRYQDMRLVLITIPSERDRGERLVTKFGDRLVLIPDKLSLTKVSAVISELDVLISPDTSLVHIARSFQVPVVGLYSRFMSNFILWRPYGQEDGAVVSNNDDNIFDITPDQVLNTFDIVYAKRKAAIS